MASVNEFPQLTALGVKADEYDQLTSTNEVAQHNLETGQPDCQPFLISAKSQTQGHGKQTRKFYSPKATGAYFTIGLPLAYFQSQPIIAPQLTITASVAAWEILSQQFHEPVAIKWVNDLFVNGKKAVGILSESAVNADNQICGVVVGWGINLVQPTDLPANLIDIVGGFGNRPVDDQKRWEIIDSVGARFLKLLTVPWSEIITIYRQHQFLKGKDLVVDLGDHQEIGRFDHITDNGELAIKTSTGIKTFSTGTIHQW